MNITMNFIEGIVTIRQELIDKYGEASDVRSFFRNTRRPQLLEKIEKVVFSILESIKDGIPPKFDCVDLSNWDNCYFDDRVKVKDPDQLKNKCVDFGKVNSRASFSAIVCLLSKIYKLLTTDQTKTRRELYYENVEAFGSQKRLDYAMSMVCLILDAPTWELGVFATSKGIMAGPVVITLSDGTEVNFDVPGGLPVPQRVLEIKSIKSSAAWILIIEKDAAFQRLIDESGLTRLGPCIFITGKGYPDVNTRLMVVSLWEQLRVPILCLVDADPYGIEIMCAYRFGTLAASPLSRHLVCPAVRWIGLHPSDIRRLAIPPLEPTMDDQKKAKALLERPYVLENERIRKQILLDENMKAEIEGVSSFSRAYLTDVYIPSKISCKEHI